MNKSTHMARKIWRVRNIHWHARRKYRKHSRKWKKHVLGSHNILINSSRLSKQWDAACRHPWPDSLSVDLATWVKSIRGNGSWRVVAREAALDGRFPFVCMSNQIDGMEICNLAMQTLGETVDDGGWN